MRRQKVRRQKLKRGWRIVRRLKIMRGSRVMSGCRMDNDWLWIRCEERITRG